MHVAWNVYCCLLSCVACRLVVQSSLHSSLFTNAFTQVKSQAKDGPAKVRARAAFACLFSLVQAFGSTLYFAQKREQSNERRMANQCNHFLCALCRFIGDTSSAQILWLVAIAMGVSWRGGEASNNNGQQGHCTKNFAQSGENSVSPS